MLVKLPVTLWFESHMFVLLHIYRTKYWVEKEGAHSKMSNITIYESEIVSHDLLEPDY